MLLLIHKPAAPLDRFVERIWYWDGAPPVHGKERIMPSGKATLIVNMAEDEVCDYTGADDSLVRRYPGTVLVGAFSRYSVIDTRAQRVIMGIEFKAGGTWPFFDPAAAELHNQHVPLKDLWGSVGDTLRERLLAAPTPRARVLLAEAELLARACRPLQRNTQIELALRHLAHPPQEYSVALLSEHLGLSARRLSRLFTLEVGLTPKLYARVKRFGRVMRLLHTPELQGSELAQMCGYFDQSHLIHECKAISGFTLTELRRRNNGNDHHVTL